MKCAVFILCVEKDETRFLTFYEFMLINFLWKLSIKVVNKYINCKALRIGVWRVCVCLGVRIGVRICVRV